MSIYMIITSPHPLDKVWEAATEELSRANQAFEAAPYGDDDAESEARYDAIATVMALPARNISDVLLKIEASGHAGPGPLEEYPLSVILDEACTVLDAAIARGAGKSLL